MHIYNTANVTDKNKESVARIIWSNDGSSACLLINGYPHAAFDFKNQRGYCRTNFSKPGKWGTNFKWDDSVMERFQTINANKLVQPTSLRSVADE